MSPLLNLALDDLVTTEDPGIHPDEPATTGEAGDNGLLLGLIALFNGLRILRILGLLGWTRARLDAALAVLTQHLAPTALRVVATDERLTLMLRPHVVPTAIRTQFENVYRADDPLDPDTAVAVTDRARRRRHHQHQHRDRPRRAFRVGSHRRPG
ncbi:hypothetical protein ACIQUM_36895 [Amycolatopsis azurea]|uniref:hypothetical protein n=1 Tax=Amycolatopsis azurea TaxID=36819 RepID=UPI00380B89BA